MLVDWDQVIDGDPSYLGTLAGNAQISSQTLPEVLLKIANAKCLLPPRDVTYLCNFYGLNNIRMNPIQLQEKKHVSTEEFWNLFGDGRDTS